MDVHHLICSQRRYFAAGRTISLSFRFQALDALKNAIERHRPDIYQAVFRDLGKSRMETRMCEVDLVLSELAFIRKHLRHWARVKHVTLRTAEFPVQQFYGTGAIWNGTDCVTLELPVSALHGAAD